MADFGISVVIPSYNRAAMLERALQSVINQTYKPAEIIVVDDGSTDNTKERVKKFVNPTIPIRYVRTVKRGVSHARNVGIDKAGQDWIAFLDSDDEWLPERLELQVNYLKANPDIKLVHGEEIWIRRGRRVNQMKKHQKSGGWIFEKCLGLCLISPSAVLVSKGLLAEVGLFDENFVVCEDYDLWLRITLRCAVGFVEEPVIVKYGGHPDQLSQKFRAMDYWRVLAMDKVGRSTKLSESNRGALANELKRKAQILLKGYEKHGNFTNFNQIQQIYQAYC